MSHVLKHDRKENMLLAGDHAPVFLASKEAARGYKITKVFKIVVENCEEKKMLRLKKKVKCEILLVLKTIVKNCKKKSYGKGVQIRG